MYRKFDNDDEKEWCEDEIKDEGVIGVVGVGDIRGVAGVIGGELCGG